MGRAMYNMLLFLSTPSARRATRPPQSWCYVEELFLSTPSARRATGPETLQRSYSGISIHALREEGDVAIRSDNGILRNFYPRPPRGGRLPQLVRCSKRDYFYPRPPRGGRPPAVGPTITASTFLSTPSARRATP